MKGALRAMGKSFRLGNSPKLQKRFISRKTLGARKGAAGFKKFMGASKEAKGRFIRSKVNANKNVKFAKKFFKSSNRTKRRWIRKKANLIKRKAAEKALAGGKAVLKAVKSSVMKKGFNPLKFVLMVFAGWLVNQLPKIIEGIKKFIDWAKPAFEILGKIVKGIVDFMKWIGGGLTKLWTAITGGDSELENAKSQLEGKNKELKETFKKQEKGFDELKNKAKAEESSLKKDMDDLDKEVKDEAAGNGKGEGTTTSTNSEGKEVASTTSTGDGKTGSTPVKSAPKTKLVMETVPIRKNTRGGGSNIIGYRSVEITVNAKTGEEISRRTINTIKGKPKDIDLAAFKKESAARIVTVDIPTPKSTLPIQDTSTKPVNQGTSDGVNRKVMLTAIDS